MKSIHPYPKPTIVELGTDLLNLSHLKLILTLVQPFVFFCLYFLFAFQEYWILAVICTMGLTFTTYGSTSHDLVHQNLKINRTVNEVFLTIIELLCFRSSHAYKVSHLYHHKRYPHEDDIEGAASRMTLLRTLFEGMIFQFKIYFWSLRNQRKHELILIVTEGFAISILLTLCLYSTKYTWIGFTYLCLMIMGSWIIPLITSYAVHTPKGATELQQTRLFRGKFFSILAFEHLYHLEHNLYPMVPHKNWPELAKRLDNYFNQYGISPVAININNALLKFLFNRNG